MSRFHPRIPAHVPERGAHTLDVWPGTVVGVHRDDVFVELDGNEDGAPRKQGLIDRRAFHRDPVVGERYRFTLRGREEELWAVDLVESDVLEQWEELEEGSLLTARVAAKGADGFQLKVGKLHAFMPFGKSGVRRSRDRDKLVGRSVVVLVLSVDDDKQRAVVSRKDVLKMQKDGRSPHEVVPGQVVHGRVSRIEVYGAFVKFGRGKEGLCHVSNLSADRVSHPSEVVKVGDVVDARVLYVRNRGKRIGLGLKQLQEDPWLRVEREHWEGQIVPIELVRVGAFGATARLCPGVEGILPRGECGSDLAHKQMHAGQRMSARILELDPDYGRVAFSLLHTTGGVIEPDEAETMAVFERERELPQIEEAFVEGSGTSLGSLLRRALERDSG